ncbi:thioesterase family protein [Pigmentiphaga soli]|uniref:Thioesterase family protein n=1 Tax=Pigmentiphaga soli TaxID=1007095 RepID=A0ABP8GKS2_9BURK
MQRAAPQPRHAYRWYRVIPTQWRDNDVYGHVNNAVHYTWFDTVVNGWLVANGLLDIGGGAVAGLVVSSACQYFGEAAFPDDIHCGLRVARIGTTSITYEIGLFRNEAALSFAAGTFVHAYVDRESRRPVPLPAALRTAAGRLLAAGDGPQP